MYKMLTVCDSEYCIIVILIVVLELIRLKAETLVVLFLIRDLTHKSFPSELNQHYVIIRNTSAVSMLIGIFHIRKFYF